MAGSGGPSTVTIDAGGVRLSVGHVPNGAFGSASSATLRTVTPPVSVAVSEIQRQRPSSVGTRTSELKPHAPRLSKPDAPWNGRHTPPASGARSYTRAPLGQ